MSIIDEDPDSTEIAERLAMVGDAVRMSLRSLKDEANTRILAKRQHVFDRINSDLIDCCKSFTNMQKEFLSQEQDSFRVDQLQSALSSQIVQINKIKNLWTTRMLDAISTEETIRLREHQQELKDTIHAALIPLLQLSKNSSYIPTEIELSPISGRGDNLSNPEFLGNILDNSIASSVFTPCNLKFNLWSDLEDHLIGLNIPACMAARSGWRFRSGLAPTRKFNGWRFIFGCKLKHASHSDFVCISYAPQDVQGRDMERKPLKRDFDNFVVDNFPFYFTLKCI